MRTIDVHDLPEEVAKAVASMVEILRLENAGQSPVGNGEQRGDAGDFDRALDELFASDTRRLPALPLPFGREDIYFDHD